MIICKLESQRQMKQVVYTSSQRFYLSHCSEADELESALSDFEKEFHDESSEVQTTDKEDHNSLNQSGKEFT